MSSPDLTDVEIAAVNEVLQTRYLSMEPRIEAFKRDVVADVDTPYVVGVSSSASGVDRCQVAFHAVGCTIGINEYDGET